MMDYSQYNQPFVAGLRTFLEYTDPCPLNGQPKNGLVPQRFLSRKEFEKRSIQRWIISELIETILNDPDHPIEDISYRFALKLCRFEIDAPNDEIRQVFSIAEEFIEKNIIGLFREREGVYP